jgi:formate dehydrogenase iron-sulfur subunit
MGAFFLLLNDPDIYGLPPDADVVTRKFESLWVPAVAEAMVLCIAA